MFDYSLLDRNPPAFWFRKALGACWLPGMRRMMMQSDDVALPPRIVAAAPRR